MGELDNLFTKDEVTLYLDNDVELRCDVIGIFPCEENDLEYIAVTPQEWENEEPPVYLYRFWQNPDDENDIKLDDIETDEEFEQASKAYDDFMADEFLLDADDENE